MNKRFKNLDVEKIIKMYTEGDSISEIMQACKCCNYTLYQVLAANNVPLRTKAYSVTAPTVCVSKKSALSSLKALQSMVFANELFEYVDDIDKVVNYVMNSTPIN